MEQNKHLFPGITPSFFALFNSENKWNYSSEIHTQTHSLSQHQNLRNCQVTIFVWKVEGNRMHKPHENFI